MLHSGATCEITRSEIHYTCRTSVGRELSEETMSLYLCILAFMLHISSSFSNDLAHGKLLIVIHRSQHYTTLPAANATISDIGIAFCVGPGPGPVGALFYTCKIITCTFDISVM